MNKTGNSGYNTMLGSAGRDWFSGLGGEDNLFGRGGADTLRGGADDDRLEGGDGNDLLIGGAGNDDLYGGNGADVLVGGAGSDRFYFGVRDVTENDGTAFGRDKVKDYTPNVDDGLRISTDGFAGPMDYVAEDRFFIGRKADAGADDLVVYNEGNGALFARIDGELTKVATLTDTPHLTAHDVLLSI